MTVPSRAPVARGLLVPTTYPVSGRPAERRVTMRLGSGAFAASCVAIEVIGVAIFIRGFFPAPVRSSASSEHGAETPAPEPVAGIRPPLPVVPAFILSHLGNKLYCFSVVSVPHNSEAFAASGPLSTFPCDNQSKSSYSSFASHLLLYSDRYSVS